jgi:hypothetical protein
MRKALAFTSAAVAAALFAVSAQAVVMLDTGFEASETVSGGTNSYTLGQPLNGSDAWLTAAGGGGHLIGGSAADQDVRFDPTANAANRRYFGEPNADNGNEFPLNSTAFFSYVVRFDTLPSTAGASFVNMNRFGGTYHGSRAAVFVKPGPTGGVLVGISTGNNDTVSDTANPWNPANATYSAQELQLGVEYVLLSEYFTGDDAANEPFHKLYINPAAPAPGVPDATNTASVPDVILNEIQFRQINFQNDDIGIPLSNPGQLVVDNLKVATTFAEAWQAIPEPSSLSLLALGGLAMLRRRRA